MAISTTGRRGSDVEVSPLIPNFSTHGWDGLAEATVDGEWIGLRWPDGHRWRAFSLWLRENAVGHSIDPVTREGIADPAHRAADTRAERASVDADGALRVVWHPDGQETRHHPGWLRHVSTGGHAVTAGLPPPRPWTAQTLHEPPTHDGGAILDDDEAMLRWVVDVARYGIARLRGTPIDAGFAAVLAGRLGPIRDTNFGLVWDVRAEVDPTSTAFTRIRLGPHTDLPTRETPPGYQVLHCLTNDVEGGEATMADGMAVVEHLRTHHPDDLDALATLRWIFNSRGRDIDHRWSAPVIELPDRGRPLTIRAFHPVRGFPDMPDADLPRAYAALTRFSAVAAEPRFRLRFRYEPGDLVCFDNRRVLHGRDSFSSRGLRHLRGLYLDHDDVRSYLRTAARRAVAADAGDAGA